MKRALQARRRRVGLYLFAELDCRPRLVIEAWELAVGFLTHSNLSFEHADED